MKTQIININDVSEYEYQKIFETLPKEKKLEIKNYRPDDIKRTLAGRLILKKAVKYLYGRDDCLVTYNENGKLLLDYCFLSISHSGDYAVCAVSEREIGIDIQKSGNFRKRKRYMLFSDNENSYVNSSSDCEEAFLTVWTMKEAYIKAVGGMLKDISEISVVADDGKLKESVDNYFFVTEYSNNYVLSICERAI